MALDNESGADLVRPHSAIWSLGRVFDPQIGYDNAAKVAKKAFAEGLSLRQAAVELGLVTEEEFDRWVDPKDMIGPRKQ